MLRPIVAIASLLAFAFSAPPLRAADPADGEWIQLFNGKDLDRLDAENPLQRAGRKLRQHVSRRRRRAEGRL